MAEWNHLRKGHLSLSQRLSCGMDSQSGALKLVALVGHGSGVAFSIMVILGPLSLGEGIDKDF